MTFLLLGPDNVGLGVFQAVVAACAQAGALYLFCRAIWLARPDGSEAIVDESDHEFSRGQVLVFYCVSIVTLTALTRLLVHWAAANGIAWNPLL